MNSISNIIIYFIAIFFSLFITTFITSNFGFVDSSKKLLFEPKGFKNLTISSIIILTLGLFASYLSTIEQRKIIAKPKIETSKPIEIDLKPITDTEARQMVEDEGYSIDDFFINIKNGERVSFVYLTNTGFTSQILSISAKSPKNKARIKILDKGNYIKMGARWSFLKPIK